MNELKFQYLSRRNFFKIFTRIVLGLAGLLGLGGLIRFFSFQPEPGSSTRHNLGPIDKFPKSGKLVSPEIPAVILQTDQGFQAFSLICTHLGCTLEESGEGFSCPCHGSKFGPLGKVTKGPAGEDLIILKVEVTENGELLVHSGEGIL
jgi:Rieske Fe-S protein